MAEVTSLNNLDKILYYLEQYLKSSAITTSLASEKSTKQVFSDGLDICTYLSNKYKKNKKDTAALILKYEEIAKEKYKPVKKSFTESELADEISYLPIYARNTFGIDIVTGKTDSIAAASITDEVKEQAQVASAFANVMEGLGTNKPNFASEVINDAAARIKLQNDINSGKLYIFKSKPAIIRSIKVFCMIGYFFLAFGLISFGVSNFIASQKFDFDGLILILLGCLSI